MQIMFVYAMHICLGALLTTYPYRGSALGLLWAPLAYTFSHTSVPTLTPNPGYATEYHETTI